MARCSSSTSTMWCWPCVTATAGDDPFVSPSHFAAEPTLANAAWRSFARDRPQRSELLATRGDRLALVREPTDDRAALVLVELDEDGRPLPPVTSRRRPRRRVRHPRRRYLLTRDPRMRPYPVHRSGVQRRRLGGRRRRAPAGPGPGVRGPSAHGIRDPRSRQAFVDFKRSNEELLSETRVRALHIRESPRRTSPSCTRSGRSSLGRVRSVRERVRLGRGVRRVGRAVPSLAHLRREPARRCPRLATSPSPPCRRAGLRQRRVAVLRGATHGRPELVATRGDRLALVRDTSAGPNRARPRRGRRGAAGRPRHLAADDLDARRSPRSTSDIADPRPLAYRRDSTSKPGLQRRRLGSRC